MKVFQLTLFALCMVAAYTRDMEYELSCDRKEINIRWPSYFSSSEYYVCLSEGGLPILNTCRPGDVFTYVLQSCTSPIDFIPPPPLNQLPIVHRASRPIYYNQPPVLNTYALMPSFEDKLEEPLFIHHEEEHIEHKENTIETVKEESHVDSDVPVPPTPPPTPPAIPVKAPSNPKKPSVPVKTSSGKNKAPLPASKPKKTSAPKAPKKKSSAPVKPKKTTKA